MTGPQYLKLAINQEVGTPIAREDVGYFFINHFLLSRIDSDLPSDLAEYDEDVNVYTASLLSGVVSGREDLLRADLVSSRDADVFARVQDSKDQRYRYRVYKANADFLYVSLGVFGEGTNGNDPARQTEEEANRMTGRGKSYYQFASAYAERLYGPRAGITEVMDKLSRNFEAYTKVMTWMSGEYLNLVHRLSEGEVFHIEHSVGGTDSQPLNRWRIVHLTDARDDQLLAVFEHMAASPWLAEHTEIYIRDTLGIQLSRKPAQGLKRRHGPGVQEAPS